MAKKMTLTTICSGAVQEKIDRALKAVGDNILDPNTDPKKKRTITMKIVFAPNEDDREDVAVSVEVSKTLAPEEGVRTQMFIAKDLESGAMTIQEHQRGEIKGQLNFDDIARLYEEEDEEVEERQDAVVGGVIDFRRQQ